MELLSRRHGAFSRLLALVGFALIFILTISSLVNVKANNENEENSLMENSNKVLGYGAGQQSNTLVVQGMLPRNLEDKKKSRKGRSKKSLKKKSKRTQSKKPTKKKQTKKHTKKTAKKTKAPKGEKKSRNPFKKLARWFNSKRKRENVKVQPKKKGKSPRRKTKKSKSKSKSKRVSSKSKESKKKAPEATEVSGQEVQEEQPVSAEEEAKLYVPTQATSYGDVSETDQKDTTYVAEPGTEVEVSAAVEPFVQYDESHKEVGDLSEEKEKKLLSMLTESVRERASPELDSSLDGLQIIKFALTSKRDCPIVTTSTSSCSANCGPGEKYRFRLWWEPDYQTCKKETLVQDCVVVSGCENLLDKWNILQVTKPDYLPTEAFIYLASEIPPESMWRRDMTSNGYVFYSFKTPLSQRFCPFSGERLDDQECGIGYRYFYTQFLDQREGGFTARGGFDREVDIVECKEEIRPSQGKAILNFLLEDYGDEVDEAGPIQSKFNELKIVEFQANELHPMCPSLATNQTSCSANGCGHGRKYSLTSRYSPVTGVCQTLRQEPCLMVSRCQDPAMKWDLLEVEKPENLPSQVFEKLASLIPPENTWEKIRTRKDNVLRVGFGFSTTWSPRYNASGKQIADNDCGAGQRWKYVREYSEQDDAILQDFIMMDATVLCRAGAEPTPVSDTFQTLETTDGHFEAAPEALIEGRPHSLEQITELGSEENSAESVDNAVSTENPQ